jgi:hypothetical protein
LNQNDADAQAQTTISNSVTGSVSYTAGELTLSTQINQSLSHPYVGLSSPPSMAYNYGMSYKPRGSTYAASLSVSENIGTVNTAVGAFSLNRQF